MRQKAYWDRPNWEFSNPNTPPVHNRDDVYPFVDPYGPLVV